MSQTYQEQVSYPQPSLFSQWWQSRSFFQKRILRMCISMLVMVLCFPLYYAGLFGTVDGPLHPARMGQWLAQLGVTRFHANMLLLTFLIVALSWNWIFNMIAMSLGARLTCIRRIDEHGEICAARVKRHKTYNKRTGFDEVFYVCEQGHKLRKTHFHPVVKGTVSHTCWVVLLIFCVIAVYSYYA